MHDLFLRALACENTNDRPPIWLMRQAGRYMASYRKLRQKHSFMGMCKHPELIAEVTTLPITEFGFDAAIIFSDILLLVEALGVHLHFEDGKGPILTPALESSRDIERLYGHAIVPRLSFVFDAIKELKKTLNIPLLGFAGLPFTVASYMIEGGANQKLQKTKKWLLEDPVGFHKLLDLLADYTIEYLNCQIDAGVDAVQLFDSWAHLLAHRQFREFCVPYTKKILSKLKKCPVIIFTKGSNAFYEELVLLKPHALSIDCQTQISLLRQKIGPQIALQGNLDPDILLGSSHIVKQEAKALVDHMRHDRGFIFNLGHGILPTTPEDNVRILVETIKG